MPRTITAETEAMICQRCGGPTEGQNIFRGDHRHFPDCIAFLRKCISELEPRAVFGDQCYQDRCENAYVEQTIVRAESQRLQSRVEALEGALNTPEILDFMKGVPLEALHQRERWGSDHDAGKTAADWFWLVGYLAGKALHAATQGREEKALHHLVTTAAALANWHSALLGKTNMRPGIMPPVEDAALHPEPASPAIAPGSSPESPASRSS